MFKKIALLSSLILAAHANDTAFGGSGASPYPIEQPNIKMVAEKIVISGQDLNKENKEGAWNYQCSFLFKNNLNCSISLQMGFPFPIWDEEMGNVAVPTGHQSKKGGALVYQFNVTARDKPIPIRRQKIAPNREKGLFYQDAYLWNLTFLPQETLTIKHQYKTGATFDVMGFNWVSYVLKTGNLWHGKRIGYTEIDVIPNTPTRLCSELNKKDQYVQPKPKGLKIIGQGKNRHYTWKLKNYSPQDDLSRLQALSAEKLSLLRHLIYAQYGREFENPKLKAYFKRQWWYEPNSAYSEQVLTPEDKKLLAVIKQLEAKKAS